VTNTAKAVLGVVYPYDSDIDDELSLFLPENVQLRSAHTPATTEDITMELIARMSLNSDIEEAAAELVPYQPGCIAYAGTATSFSRGLGCDRDISHRIEARTSVPATTTSTSMVRALKALGVQKVAVGAPYPSEVNAALQAFLEASGLVVAQLSGLDLARATEIGELSLTDVADLIRSAYSPESEAVFVSCTGIRAATIIEDLEEELGIPVLSANQVTIWDGLRVMGIEEMPSDRGRLFRVANG